MIFDLGEQKEAKRLAADTICLAAKDSLEAIARYTDQTIIYLMSYSVLIKLVD